MGQIIKEFNMNTKAEYRAFETENLFGDKYQAKQNHEFLSCIFCGRDTSKQGKSNGVMVGCGGSVIVHPEDYEIALDGGAMGWFPVGSECIKEVPKEFRVPNIYNDKIKGV